MTVNVKHELGGSGHWPSLKSSLQCTLCWILQTCWKGLTVLRCGYAERRAVLSNTHAQHDHVPSETALHMACATSLSLHEYAIYSHSAAWP